MATVYSLIDKTVRASLATLTSKLQALAYKNKAEITDIDASGTPSNANFLRGDGTWSPAGSGTPPVIDTTGLTITWTDAQGNQVVGYITTGTGS